MGVIPHGEKVCSFLAGDFLRRCNMNEKIQIVLPAQAVEAIREAARADGKTVDEWIKELLASGLISEQDKAVAIRRVTHISDRREGGRP